MNNEQNAIPFSVSDWERLVVKEKTHHLETSKGRCKARIICTDREAGLHSIVALVMNEIMHVEATEVFMKEDDRLLIVPNPPKLLGWLNVYVNPYRTYVDWASTRETADRIAKPDRVTCIEVFEGQGLDKLTEL